MRLGGMHEKRMAQIYCSRFTRSQHLGPPSGLFESIRGELSQRQAGFAGGREQARNIEVRAGSNAGRSIMLPNVGEEEEHQQRASLRSHVDMPVEEVARVAGLWWKACVHVPTGVDGIFRAGETDREGTETIARKPPACPDELVEGLVEHRSVCRQRKWLLRIHAEPDDRLCPCSWIVLVAPRIAPEDGTASVG